MNGLRIYDEFFEGWGASVPYILQRTQQIMNGFRRNCLRGMEHGDDGPRTNRLDFGGDPNDNPDTAFMNPDLGS